MATEAHTTEPVALLERGANNQLTAAEFNQPAEIANDSVKSENVKTSIDAVVESGIKGNAGAPEGGSFFESPTVVKVLVVKEIQQNEDLDAAEGTASKDNGVGDETEEIEGKRITNNETVEVKNEYADAVANVQDLAEGKQTGGSEQNEEEGKRKDESVEQETIREVSSILEASLGQTNEAVIDTNEQKLNDSDDSVDEITDGIENERKDAATSTETAVIEERSLGGAISINQNNNREVEVIENKTNEPPVLLSTVEDELELTSVACKEEHEETEILDKTGEADVSESVKPKEEKNPEQKFDDLVSKHEEGKQSVIKEQISSDASAGEGRDENVHTVIAAEENITEVAAPEEMPSPKENLIQKDEPENEKIESSEKVSKETETAASNEIKNQEDCVDEVKEEKSNDTDIISDSGIPNEEISPPTTLDEKAKNADVERENKNADDRHPSRSLEQEITLPEGKKLEKSSDFKHQELVDNESGVSTREETTPKLVSETTETGDEQLKHVSDSKENLDIKDAGKNMEEGDLQVEISATRSNDTESKDEEKSVFNDNIVERSLEPENIQEAETKLQAEVGEDVKEKIPEENVESNSQESVDEDQTEDLQSDDKMTGQSSTENFEEHGTTRTINNVVKETNQIDGITNLTEQECLQSENRTLAVEPITNVKEGTDKEGPREDIKDKDQSRVLSEEIASKDDIIEVQEIIQTMAEAEDTGKQDSVVEDKIEVIAREMHEDPLQEEKGDDLDSTKLKEEIEDSKTEFTESIEERGYVEERESETLKDNEEPNTELTPAKASEETMLQKDVNESLAKIPTLEPESKEETLEREKYDIDDSNNAPTTTKETILEEGESEDKVEMQSSNLARGKEPIEMGMESDKLHQMDVDAESANATNLDGSRDPEIAVVENEVEEQIEHEIQTEAPIEGTEDQANATASETPSAYMSDDILKECSTMPSQESEFVSSEASEIVDEDAEEKSKTSLTEVVEEKAGTYNNELEGADTEIITQQECASKTTTGEESQEIICDTNQSELGEKMTDFKNESSEFVEQKSQEGHHETQEKEEPEEPRDHVKETQDADEIVKAVILTEEVQDVEEADGEDKTVKLANEEKEVIKEPHNELTEAESGKKAEESISTEQSKASDFNEQRETVRSDVQEASVMENEILIAKQTEVKQEQDEAGGKSTGDSSTAAVQQSEEMKREITEGADSPRDKIKEITTSETSLDETQTDDKTAQASNTTEDESSIDTVDVEASQQDNVVNRIAVEENSSNLASQHLAENNEKATEEQIEDADEAEERKKASDVDVVHESVDHYVEDVNAGESIEEAKEDSETVFKSRNIEALEKCKISADQTVTEKRTKEEELTPSPEIPSKEEEYETKTVQNEEESTKEVGIVYESSVKSSASNSTNETCMTKEEHREVCVSELGLDSPNEVHEENKGTLDEKVEVKETSETATLSNSQCLEAAIEHVVACDQTFHGDKGQEHEEVCIQTNESRELEASQPSLEFNEDKKDESQDETDEKKEAPGVISEASLQTLPVQRIDGQNQTSSELLSEEQEDGISASMDVVAEEEISSDQTLLTEKLKEQKETLSEQEHVASATIESEESSKEVEVEVEVVVVDDETKTTKEVSLQMEVPEEHEIQKEGPKEVREDEDSGESREDIKEAAGLSSRPDSQDLKAPKEDEIATDTTLVTEEKSEAKSQTPSDAMIDETPATSEHIEQHTQEGENIEKSACFSTEGTKEVEALEVEIEKVTVNEVSNKDGGTPEVLKLQPHENPSNDAEREVITGSEVQSYEKTRESEESEVKEKHLVAAIPDFVQTNQPKETVDATDVAGNEITNEEVADKKEEWESSSPVTLNGETTKESSQLHELTAEERLGDDMIEKEIQNKKECGAEISDVKESVGEVEISSDENLPIAKSGEPSEMPSAQEKQEEYVEVTTKEVEVVEDESSRTESVSFPKEGDTKLETCHSKCPLDAEEQKEAPKEVHEEEDIAPAETREEIKKDVECESVPNSDSQGFESTKDEIVSGDTLATGKTLEEKSKTPSADLVSQITILLEETEDQAKPEETQGDNKLQTKEQEFQGLALEKESKEEGEVPDEAFKLESQENQTVMEEREFLTKNEEVVGLSKETSNLKTKISEETSKSESEIDGSEVKDTQREEAITNDTTEPMLKEVINEGITEDKDDAKGTPLIIGSDVTTKECHQEPEEKPGESLGDQKTTEKPQTEEEVDTEISNAKDEVEDDTITTDKSLPVAKLDEIQSVALLSEEQKQGTSGTTDFIKEVKGVEGTEEPKATEEVPLQKEEPGELGVSQVETQLDKYVLEAPKEVHEGEATTKQMDVIGDVPVIMEEASWQKEEPRGPEISESKRPLDADIQMDSQKEIHKEEDSAPIDTKEEIKEQDVGTEILGTEEAVEEDKITSDKTLPDSKLEDEKEIQSVALFSEEQKHVTSATTECIKEVMKGVEGTEDEPKTTEQVPLQKEEPGELGLSQLETHLEIYIEETPKEVHEGEATTKKVEMIGDVPNIIEEASLQKEEPRGAEISESKQLLDADVQMDSQKEVHEEEENALIETKEEIKEEEVSTEISESKEAVEDKNTSDKSLPFAKLEEQNEIQSVALLSEEQKQGTSATTDCIKEVTKGVEGTEVEPKTTEEVPLRKEEPRELEVFQEETQLNKYVQETLKEVHEGEATTKEVEVIGDVPNIMEEASLQKEEPKEPEISESYRLLDADVKMHSQNEVHAEEKSSPIKTEEEVESKSMSNSDSHVFEAPKEGKITSAETLATEEKSEEQSQIPFAALVSETTPPSEKEEQEKAVETPEEDNLKNSATPNDLEVQGLVLDKDQSLEEEKTQDEAVKLAPKENKTNIKDEKSLHESERVTEIVGLPKVNTEPGKTETKEEEAIATKIVDNEVINDEVAEDKDALIVSEVTTTECHQEPQPNLDESLKDKTIEELQTKEDFCTEKSDAKEEIVEEKVTSDKSLLMAKSEGKIQIQPAALRLEEQTQGASATIESRKEATEDIEGIIDEPKTTEEVPLRKEAHSDLEGSKLETPVRNCILESPKEIQQEESEVTGKTREGKKGASETPLKSDSNEIEDKSDSNSKDISAALASKTTTILEKIEDPKREVETPGNENPQISKEESKETEEGEVPGEASKLENQESKSKTTHAECPPQPETTSNLKAEQTSKLDSEIHSYEVVPKPVETEIIKNLPEEEKTDMQQNTIDTVKVQQINLTDEQVTESKQGTIIESQQKYELKPENNKAAKDIQNEKVEKSQEERKTANATPGDKKTSEAEERGTAEGRFSLQDMLEKSTRQSPHAAEETKEAEKAKSGGEEEDAEEEQKNCDSSGSDAPVMVEAFREMEIKTPHKKSLLSGVGSKVKHSISKVKKAITGSGGGGGKSSSQAKQQHSPK